MINLSDGCYVAADHIAEVSVNDYSTVITVRTKDGTAHCHQPIYGEGVYTALDRLIAQINAATASTKNTPESAHD